MVSYIESNPNEFTELINLAFVNKQPYSWRAAWLLWTCMKKNDKRVEKYILPIINILEKVNDSQKRNLINVLRKMEINEQHEGLLFDICVNIWTEIDKQPSVRSKALEMIIQITKKHIELYNEVEVLTQNYYVDSLSNGIKMSIVKKIKELEKFAGNYKNI